MDGTVERSGFCHVISKTIIALILAGNFSHPASVSITNEFGFLSRFIVVEAV